MFRTPASGLGHLQGGQGEKDILLGLSLGKDQPMRNT